MTLWHTHTHTHNMIWPLLYVEYVLNIGHCVEYLQTVYSYIVSQFLYFEWPIKCTCVYRKLCRNRIVSGISPERQKRQYLNEHTHTTIGLRFRENSCLISCTQFFDFFLWRKSRNVCKGPFTNHTHVYDQQWGHCCLRFAGW